MKNFTWQEVCLRRLYRSYLLEPAPEEMLIGAVSAVGGIQAQVLSAAELAIGARVSGISQVNVQIDLWERRRLVKSYGPRGTLHLLPAVELPLWMAAMRARASLKEEYWYQSAGLDRAQSQALLETIGEVLDGECLTRAQLAEAAGRRLGDWAREKLSSTWGNLLPPAAYTGRLCFGPNSGSQATFLRADQWTGAFEEDLDPRQALREVLRRYLGAYGPAQPADFARWFWLEKGEAASLFGELGPELEEVRLEGQPAWVLSGDTDLYQSSQSASLPHPAGGSLRLLPQYDCYVLGCVPRQRLLTETARERVFAHGRGRFEGAVGLPILLIDGMVAGIWQRRKRGARLEVKVEPFQPLSVSQLQQLEAEAARSAEFLGLSPSLSMGPLGAEN